MLVDHARRRSRQKRGGGAPVVDLDSNPVAAPERAGELLALDEALQRLSAAEPYARLVELRYFSGLGRADRRARRSLRSHDQRRWRVAARALSRSPAPGAALWRSRGLPSDCRRFRTAGAGARPRRAARARPRRSWLRWRRSPPGIRSWREGFVAPRRDSDAGDYSKRPAGEIAAGNG
ncbi:MAG: ECF-type sigma factor [Thermoanaerobaculia bacterium]